MALAEHTKGQYLVVTGGVGLTQEWGKPAHRIQPGNKARDGQAAHTPRPEQELTMGRETVSSSNVTGQRCIHSRHCVLDRPDVFVPNVKGAWIHPERATPEEVLELAHNCPSGAIQCQHPPPTARCM